MDHKKYFKEAGEIVLLNDTVMRQVADDKEALYEGFFILTLSVFLGSLGYFLFPNPGIVVYRPDFFTVIKNTIETTIISLISFYAVGYVLQEFFKSKLNMNGFVHIMCFASLIRFIDILPKLSPISAIWGLVILLATSRKVAKLDWPETAVLFLVMMGVGFLLR